MKTDGGGEVLRADIKLQSTPGSTWKTRLSQIARQGEIRIATYSLPGVMTISQILSKRTDGIAMIAHSKFADRAKEIVRKFPYVQIGLHDKVHSKFVVIEPKTVIISSANFGCSGWHEASITIDSPKAVEFFNNVWGRMWLEISQFICMVN